MARPADEALIGRTLAGKFVVESFIGGGAMGAVYRAKQLSLDKSVAIKVLHGDLVDDPTFVARFQREAKAASRLDHPNSMRVLDYGRDADGLCYIAMELLDGESLFALLREARGPLPDRRTVDLLRQVLAALAVAHEMGVVHRDLKPENIIVLQSRSDDGQITETVKVCDFGMAKVLTGDGAADANVEKLTSHGVIVGTPEYMSPEQGKGEELDVRSDLYSVGVILYQMLTGKLPFQADTPIATVLKHLVEEPKPPSQVVSGVNVGLEAVCLRALRKVRDERFASAREMRSALRDAAEDGPRSTEPALRSRLVSSPGADEPPPTRVVAIPLAAAAMPRRTAAATLASGAEPSHMPTILVLSALLAVLVAVGGFVVLRKRSAPAPIVQHEPHAATSSPAIPSTKPPAPTAGSIPSSAEPSPVVPATAPSVKSPVPALTSKTALKSPAAEVTSARAMAVLTTAPVTAPSASAVATAPLASASAPLPPDTPPPPSPDPFGNASVSFGAVKTSHAQPSDVLSALPSWRFTQCYRDGLRAQGGPPVHGSGTLHVGFDGSGHVSEATFAGPPALAVIGQCVASSAIGSNVRNVELGATGADVDLSFKPD